MKEAAKENSFEVTSKTGWDYLNDCATFLCLRNVFLSFACFDIYYFEYSLQEFKNNRQ